MTRKPIPVSDFSVRPNHLWCEQWMLLTVGDFSQGRFNTMTVAWGSLGTMWQKPMVQIVVRPGRYTYEFTEQFDSFTLSALPETYRKALQILGWEVKDGKCDADLLRIFIDAEIYKKVL